MITGGPRVTVIVNVTAALVPVALAAVRLTLVEPVVVGVPEINPVAGLTVTPAGNGVAVKLVGLFVAVIWKLNAPPVCPLAVVALVITGLPNVIVIVKVTALLVPPAFVAVRLTLVAPVAVGVPEIKPVAVLTVTPAGSGLAVKLVGLLVAVI